MRHDTHGYDWIFPVSVVWFLISPGTMAELSRPVTDFIYPAQIIICGRQFLNFDSYMFICLMAYVYWVLFFIILSIRSRVQFSIFLFWFILKAGILYLLSPFFAICLLVFFNVTVEASDIWCPEFVVLSQSIVPLFIFRAIVLNDFWLTYYKKSVATRGGE